MNVEKPFLLALAVSPPVTRSAISIKLRNGPASIPPAAPLLPPANLLSDAQPNRPRFRYTTESATFSAITDKDIENSQIHEPATRADTFSAIANKDSKNFSAQTQATKSSSNLWITHPQPVDKSKPANFTAIADAKLENSKTTNPQSRATFAPATADANPEKNNRSSPTPPNTSAKPLYPLKAC